MTNKKPVDPDLADFDDEPVVQESEKPAPKKEQPGIGHPSYTDLEAQLNTAEAKSNEYFEKLLRQQAELDNVRKRGERDLVQAHKFALEKFALELLPVVDNLERALEQKMVEAAAALQQGVELTLKILQGALEKFGIKVINPVNQMFDPAFHEAMSAQPVADKPPGTVLTVLQKGYQLNERLLRPALVIVSKAVE